MGRGILILSIQITDYFNVDKGLTIPSPGGTRRVTEAVDSYSQLYTSLSTSSTATKHCIDACWESGNIYIIDSNAYVKKVAFDGTVLASLQLTNPVAVSVIQYDTTMQTEITNPPQDDQGCWIADVGTGKIIKTDKDLNIVADYDGVFGAICLEADNEGGCYIAERRLVSESYEGTLILLDSDAGIKALRSFDDFSTTIDFIDEMVIDANAQLRVLANDILFNLSYSGGQIVEIYDIDLLGDFEPFSSSSSEGDEGISTEEYHVVAMDVDKSSGSIQYTYVAGGNSTEGWCLRISSAGVLNREKRYSDMSFPYVLKVVQGLESTSFYILSDPAKWDSHGYGSSSSSSSFGYSSSSSEGYSSSSSSVGYSSSSSSIDSSSSSSSSGDLWTPSEIDTAGWYDASDADTIITDVGVSQWNDKSTNNRHLLQTIDTNYQPTTGVQTIGGLNALGFDGSNDYMIKTSEDYGITTDLSAFFVINKISYGNNDGFISFFPNGGNDVGTTAGRGFEQEDADGRFRLIAGPGNDMLITLTDASLDVGNDFLISTGQGSGSGFAGYNGNDISTDAYTYTPVAPFGFLVGSRYLGSHTGHSNLKVGEVILLNTKSGDSERQKIEGYLAWKWSQVDKLPSNHPYKLHPPYVNDDPHGFSSSSSD